MARGPQQKPAELQVKLGNPRRRARAALTAALSETAADTNTSDAAFPEAPADLSDIARPYWNEAARWLASRHLLKGIEPHALARYCEYYGMWRAARDALTDRRASSGLRTTYTTVSASGSKMQRVRPEFKIMLDMEHELTRIGDRFGLTPSTRAALAGRLASIRDKPLDNPRSATSDAGAPKSDGPIGAALAATSKPSAPTKPH